MGANDFILDGMRWSFSSVNSYTQCPQCFRLGYLDALPRVGNAFSDWGSFMHHLMELYFKGEIEFFEMSQAYEDGYNGNVTHKFPTNRFCDLSERYYLSGKEYLDSFEGLFDGYNVVAVEQRVLFDINGRPFVGVIDLVVEKDGTYLIIDHKSKSSFKSKREQAEYARQLYLYALHIKMEYGKWPESMYFHMIRSGGELIEVPFKIEELDAAVEWFLSTIDKIYADTQFISEPNKIRKQIEDVKKQYENKEIGFQEYQKQKKSLVSALKKMSFFCRELCGVREICPEQDKAPREG